MLSESKLLNPVLMDSVEKRAPHHAFNRNAPSSLNDRQKLLTEG